MSRCRECDHRLEASKGDFRIKKQYLGDYCKACVSKDKTYEEVDLKVYTAVADKEKPNDRIDEN